MDYFNAFWTGGQNLCLAVLWYFWSAPVLF